MDSALVMHRLHFAFTITYHYLFPQLTMGLALLILILKTMALWTRDERYSGSARFWAKIFAINFAFGVITGIPMEFQFGTNWAAFSREAGAVIGQTLGMEGVFSFFLESTFLGLFLYGEKRLTPLSHWGAAFMVFLGSWLSGYLIIATDAWMQHPVGYQIGPDGHVMLTSFWALADQSVGTVAVSSQHVRLRGHRLLRDVGHRRLLPADAPARRVRAHVSSRGGDRAAFIFVMMLPFPTGDGQGKAVAIQPAPNLGRHGRAVSERGRRAHGVDRAAGYGKAAAR